MVDKNIVGDVGAMEIAKALKANKKLNELHLGTNKIGETGAIALADAVGKNVGLNELYLGIASFDWCRV